VTKKEIILEIKDRIRRHKKALKLNYPEGSREVVNEFSFLLALMKKKGNIK
jgi:hypothetical protein